MSLKKFKGVSSIQNLEIYLGVHRHYSRYKNPKAIFFISLHVVFRIILTLYIAVLAIGAGRNGIDRITYYTWMLYLSVQVFEIIMVQVSAVRYSDEYMKLIDTLKRTSKLLNVKDTVAYNKYVWYLRFVNCFLVVIFIANVTIMWFSPIFDLNFFKVLIVTISWHSMLFTHLLQDALCAIIFNIIAGIVNTLDDNLLTVIDINNNKSEKLMKNILIERKEQEISLDRFWSVYEGIETSCTSFNKIFAAQVIINYYCYIDVKILKFYIQ